MSTLKVNRIEPRTGNTVEIVGLAKPSKSILQVVSNTYNVQETFASGTPTKSEFKTSITRVEPDSDVIAFVSSNLYMKDGIKSYIRMFSYVYVDDSHFADVGRIGSDMTGGDNKWIHMFASGSYVIPSASLNATSEISMWYAPDGTNQPLMLNANLGTSTMTLMEVSV